VQLYDELTYNQLIHNAILVCDASVTIASNGQYVYAYVDTLSIAETDQSLANDWYHSDYKDGYYMVYIDNEKEESTHYLTRLEMTEWENTFSQMESIKV